MNADEEFDLEGMSLEYWKILGLAPKNRDQAQDFVKLFSSLNDDELLNYLGYFVHSKVGATHEIDYLILHYFFIYLSNHQLNLISGFYKDRYAYCVKSGFGF